MKSLLPLAIIAATLGLAVPAHACQDRTAVLQGESLAQIAARCGVNVEALRAANPGLNAATARGGTFLVVPSMPLPSAQSGYGRPSVTIQPPIAAGGRPVGSVAVSSPRIVLPAPPPPPVFQTLDPHGTAAPGLPLR